MSGLCTCISFPNASLETLQAFFFFLAFFFPEVVFVEVPRARNSDATIFLVQMTNVAHEP